LVCTPNSFRPLASILRIIALSPPPRFAPNPLCFLVDMSRLLLITVHASLLLLLARSSQALPKILCLHGGGMTGASFSSSIQDLQNALAGEYEFVFADGAYGSGSSKLWVSDPPGGKGQATTDPHFADLSLDALDAIVAAEGPFYGLLGYSQGSAFAPVYLSHAPAGTFQKVFLFCGYVPSTHAGLVSSIDAASPFGGLPALVWMGANDYVISNSMTSEQAALFTSPQIITSSAGYHAVPGQGDGTFSQVLASIRSGESDSESGSGGSGSGSGDDSSGGENVTLDPGAGVGSSSPPYAPFSLLFILLLSAVWELIY